MAFAQILSEAGVILFMAAARGGDDHAVARRKFAEERRARGGRVDHGQGTVKRFKALRQFRRRQVGAGEIELGLLAVEGAVTDEHQPQLARPSLGSSAKACMSRSRSVDSFVFPGRW